MDLTERESKMSYQKKKKERKREQDDDGHGLDPTLHVTSLFFFLGGTSLMPYLNLHSCEGKSNYEYHVIALQRYS